MTVQFASLREALFHAQGLVQPVSRDSYNTHSRYHYASADSMLTAAKAALMDSGLMLTMRDWSWVDPVGGHEQIQIHCRLTHLASSEEEAWEILWPVFEKPGMPFDKALAAALTSSMGYALRGLLQMPRPDAEEMDKRDDSDHEPKKRDEPDPNIDLVNLWKQFLEVGGEDNLKKACKAAGMKFPEKSIEKAATKSYPQKMLGKYLQAEIKKRRSDPAVQYAVLHEKMTNLVQEWEMLQGETFDPSGPLGEPLEGKPNLGQLRRLVSHLEKDVGRLRAAE